MTGWHINYYLLGRGLPVSAGVYITDACNCRCIMCNIWKRKKPSIYPFSAQRKAIDALAKVGCSYYSLSGGEPTLVKDLPERLAYAAKKIPYVHLVTNGLAMTPELARAISVSGVKEISISIDGNDEYHNLMRGVPDAADRVWNCLDILSCYAPNIQCVVNSVITLYNLEGLRELGKRLAGFTGVYQKYLPLTFNEFFDNQHFKSFFVSWEPASPSEIERFLEDAVSNPRIVNSSVFLRKIRLFLKGEQNIIPEQKRCLYSYHSVEFDSKGFAYPCITGMDFKGGISPEYDLEEYFKSPEHRRRQKQLESCSQCEGSMMLCYYEPRLNFPLHNLLYYMLKGE